jgi:hypothetical protein
MTWNQFITIITFCTVVAFYAILATSIPLAVLLTSLPMVYHKESLWKSNVFEKGHVPSLASNTILLRKSY